MPLVAAVGRRASGWRHGGRIVAAVTALSCHAVVTPTAPVRAQPAATPPRLSPAILQGAQQFDLTSTETGRTYRIYVARPAGSPPRGGWPVVYVLDVDFVFATVATQNRLRSTYGDKGAVIVGIGYPDAASALTLRNRDFTPSPPTELGRAIGYLGSAKSEGFGGAAVFDRFMVEELRPLIAAAFPVDPGDQTLIGYSYGGLFVLDVLFKHPGLYRTYVIGSPSIWWNDREVLKNERGFDEAVRSGRAAPRILITSDEWEQDPDRSKLPDDAGARTSIRTAMARQRMVDAARELADRLAALHGGPGYRVRYQLLGQETHLTGMPAAATRGLAFALMP